MCFFKSCINEYDLILFIDEIDEINKIDKNPTFYFSEKISFDLISKIISGNPNLKTTIVGIEQEVLQQE